jgi:hypothetical protein
MKPTQEPWERGLTRERAAAYLGVAPTTLDKLDVPKRKRLTGAVRDLTRYDRHDLDRWLDTRLREDGSVPPANDPGDDPDEWGDPDME